MFLCTQYYRAPFPHKKYWADDFSRIRDCGIHAVQLWALWGWIEAKPGIFNYNDYDELVTLAGKKGLKVVLSTIAEIHPFWIHRKIPGSNMVDHMGHVVISSPRVECNVGLTPGGCTDNPQVAQRMGRFLADIAAHYRGTNHLLGYDCWNETRWNVHADGHVCYCTHSLREWRSWLNKRHGGLEGLSQAWQRRYDSWEDVFPGKLPTRPYVEAIEFLRWLTVRATNHVRFRYDAIRAGDPDIFVSAHCGVPAIQSGGDEYEQALCRGIDSDLADQLDGFGCSHFPFWGEGFDEEGFGVRVESTRSANRGKVTWVSELHGGSAREGVMAHRSVPAGPQQRWVANGMARGAKAIIFWCWRDEVFGRESSGFGLAGWDGLAKQRLSAMKKTSAVINKHNALIEAYQPEPAKVGVLFTPDNYMLKWAENGEAWHPVNGVVGYATALERLRIPYEIVEAHHLDMLDQLDVLLMPWSLIIPPQAREAILKFLQRGGRILCEAETDAFDELAFYRYPDERPFMQALGVHDLGRRKLGGDTGFTVEIGKKAFDLRADNFTTPLHAGEAAVLARDEKEQPLVVRQKVGKGAAYIVGTFLGDSYGKGKNPQLEEFVQAICDDAGVKRSFDVDAGDGNRLLQWRTGRSGKSNLLWIINGGGDRTVTVTDKARKFGSASSATELVRGKTLRISATRAGKQLTVPVPEGGFAILKW